MTGKTTPTTRPIINGRVAKIKTPEYAQATLAITTVDMILFHAIQSERQV
jgi:hypothetical protein